MNCREKMIEAFENWSLHINGGIGFVGGQAVSYEAYLPYGDTRWNYTKYYEIYIHDNDIRISKPKGKFPNYWYWTTNERLLVTNKLKNENGSKYYEPITIEEICDQIINVDWFKRFNINLTEMRNCIYVIEYKRELIRLLIEKGVIVYGTCCGETKYYPADKVKSYKIEVLEHDVENIVDGIQTR